MPASRTLIIIAHAAKQRDLVRVLRHRTDLLGEYKLLATTETGEVLRAELGLEVTSLFSGHQGGEIQLCGLICTNTIKAVIFLRDPCNPAVDEPDIQPFYRVCDLNNVPLATNTVSIAALLTWLGRRQESESPSSRAELRSVEV